MAVTTCAHCGDAFRAPPSNRRKYCTKACYTRAQRKNRSVTCAHCRTIFVTSRKGRIYCARSCYMAHKPVVRGTKVRKCLACQTPFPVVKSKQDRTPYCSLSCFRSWQSAHRARRKRFDCRHCHRRFYGERHHLRMYCSVSCRIEATLVRKRATTRVEKRCFECDKSFTVKAYRRDTAKFCSHACNAAYYFSSKTFNHEHKWGNIYSKGLPRDNAFKPGDNRGRDNAKFVEAIRHACAECAETFYKKPWQTKRNQKHVFCGKPCQLRFLRKQVGALSHTWVGGIDSYRGRNWKNIRLEIVARDKGTCRHCQEVVGPSISVHHIKPWRLFVRKGWANKPSNLMCLCQSCHMKEEHRATRKYG